jgi:tripartite-type tricarboxylate transporter receptor subunit TctC
MKKIARLLAGAVASTIILAAATATAQEEWPAKPVTVVVPFKAGGITDIVARRLEPALSKALGEAVVVTNIAGHSSVGTRRVIDAKPDGYEFLIHETGIMTAQASGVQAFGYKDLKPVAAMANLCLVMLARADTGWTTVADVAKGAEGRQLIAGVTIGGLSHIVALASAELGGFDVRPVQVGGSADAYAAMLGKQIDLMYASPADAMNYTRGPDGKPRADADVRAILYFGDETFPGMPEVQNMKEAGSDATICAPHIIFAPKETPDAIVDVMADALQQAYGSGELREFMAGIGGTELFVRGADLEPFLQAQWDAIAPVAERSQTGK